MKRFARRLALTALILTTGCGQRMAPSSEGDMAAKASMPEASRAAYAPSAAGVAADATTDVKPLAQLPHKIIYNAQVELVAPDLSQAARELTQRVKARRGYIASQDVSGATGAPRQGTWKVRVPVAAFDDFLTDVSRLGELQTTHTDSDDVSAEFYDSQARLTNKRVEEQRLLRALTERTSKLSDVLLVERELSRVRGEIEQLQSRLRVLSSLTDLSTVTIVIRELKEFAAPQNPTFGQQIARSFTVSLHSLRDVGKALVLAAVALAPWLLVLALVAVPTARLLHRRLDRNPGLPTRTPPD